MTPRVEFSSSDSPFSVGLQAAALVACGREAPPTWEQPLPGPGQSHTAERVQCGQGHRQLAFLFSFFFLAVLHSLGILVPQPGIEPGPSAVKAVSLNHWTSRGVPGFFVSILVSVFQIFTNVSKVSRRKCGALHVRENPTPLNVESGGLGRATAPCWLRGSENVSQP